jgi:hypothetical protein
MALIAVRDLTKDYRVGDVTVHALRRLTLEIHGGELTAAMYRNYPTTSCR